MPFAPTLVLTNSKVKPACPMHECSSRSVRLPGGINYSAGQVLEEVAGGTPVNAAHTITFGGTPSGGSFLLTYITAYGPKATKPIAFSGTAATMVANLQASLNDLLGAGNTVVSGTGPYTITYQNDLGSLPLAIPTATNNLTGSSPTVTPASSVTGRFPGVLYQARASGTAICILEYDVQTDMAGSVINEFGVASNDNTVPAFDKGDFHATDAAGNLLIPGLDSTTLGHLGKLVRGASLSAPGAILRIT